MAGVHVFFALKHLLHISFIRKKKSYSGKLMWKERLYMKFGYNFGDKCNEQKGNIVDSWMTGDMECDAESRRYECGGVYHNNYMDEVGSRDYDCFWDCSGCKRNQIDKMKGIN